MIIVHAPVYIYIRSCRIPEGGELYSYFFTCPESIISIILWVVAKISPQKL